MRKRVSDSAIWRFGRAARDGRNRWSGWQPSTLGSTYLVGIIGRLIGSSHKVDDVSLGGDEEDFEQQVV